MHPSEAIRGESSSLLEGRRIVLGVTGSIAAVKTVEIARELIRHGADVVPVMTRAATRIIHPDALEFATGHAPVTELTGATEHVTEMGGVPPTVAGLAEGAGGADLLLIAPCTANTASKIALGVDDSPVTTFASTGLTTTPVVLAPAMHETMVQNPFVAENLQRLRDAGVHVVDPVREEWKAKLASKEVLAEWCIRLLGGQELAGKRVLVVTGSTIEPIDGMRVITNKSTGRMGMALARQAFRLGADVTLWFGHGHVDHLPPNVPIERFVTVQDLLDRTSELGGYDLVLVPAAISDFGPPRTEGKIPSGDGDLELRLEALPKVVKAWRKACSGTLVSFKAEVGVSDDDLLERARANLKATGSALVVANDLERVQVDRTRVLVVEPQDHRVLEGSKDDVARDILLHLARQEHEGEGA